METPTVWLFVMRIKCEYDCSLMILEYSVIGTYRYTRYKKDSWNMAFRRALSINSLRRAILAFVYVYMCSFTGLSNFDTPGDTTRSDTNWFSRGVQPIFRDICFSCSRAITIHQVIAIFLQFHCLSSYRNDSFPLQLIDQITFLLSRQMCHVN